MSVNKKILDGLNEAMNLELKAAVWYTHRSFFVFGPARGPIVGLFREQASESMGHATKVGEKLSALGGTPRIQIGDAFTGKTGTPEEMLRESLGIERAALEQYKRLLKLVEEDVALDVMLSDLVAEETSHIEELEKFLRT